MGRRRQVEGSAGEASGFGGEGSPWRFRGSPLALEWVAAGWHLRVVQPYRARKPYRCPGCDHEIAPRTMHVVVWPEGSAEQRRHWHRGCWERHFARLRGR